MKTFKQVLAEGKTLKPGKYWATKDTESKYGLMYWLEDTGMNKVGRLMYSPSTGEIVIFGDGNKVLYDIKVKK